jgi:hypothetical protein
LGQNDPGRTGIGATRFMVWTGFGAKRPGIIKHWQQYNKTITALCVAKHPDLSTLRVLFPPSGWQIWMFPYTEGRNCILFLWKVDFAHTTTYHWCYLLYEHLYCLVFSNSNFTCIYIIVMPFQLLVKNCYYYKIRWSWKYHHLSVNIANNRLYNSLNLVRDGKY